MSNQKDSGSFLNRWSARKRQSAHPLVDDTAEDAAEDAAAAIPEPGVEPNLPLSAQEPLLSVDQPASAGRPVHPSPASSTETIEALLTDADMPAISSLTARSDLSGFFSKGVSASLRKAALRHVFQQPSYNVRDGLDDYDGDYTSFEPLGDTVTADMKFHAARKERARQEAELRAEEKQATLAQEMSDSRAEAERDEQVDPEHGQATVGPVDEPEADEQDDQVVSDQEEHFRTRQTAQAGQEAGLLQEQPQEPTPATHKPLLTRPTQSTASQPCETPNE